LITLYSLFVILSILNGKISMFLSGRITMRKEVVTTAIYDNMVTIVNISLSEGKFDLDVGVPDSDEICKAAGH
jgi:hypothetical protein